MALFLIILLLLCIGLYLYSKHPRFYTPQNYTAPTSKHFKDDQFYNQEDRPVMVTHDGFLKQLYKFMTAKVKDARPQKALPSEKTDLQTLDRAENCVIWMGHSSYFVQLEGVRLLIDPILACNASPVPLTNVAFKGSHLYRPSDIPDIDVLLITHDHWDHLDYATIVALRSKVKTVITPLGVGSYFKKWHYPEEIIKEGDWYDHFEAYGLSFHILPTHHFSGRLFQRNRTLWGSFAVMSSTYRLYFGGDSGYGRHFCEISETLGGFDLVFLEAGQYNERWPHIHMAPEETLKAASDLKARALLPGHNSKFKLSLHSWYEPFERLVALQEGTEDAVDLCLPLIGQKIPLEQPTSVSSYWWKAYLL